jgi:hypothetical protein
MFETILESEGAKKTSTLPEAFFWGLTKVSMSGCKEAEEVSLICL